MAVSEVADAMIPDPSATNEFLASFSFLDFSDWHNDVGFLKVRVFEGSAIVDLHLDLP